MSGPAYLVMFFLFSCLFVFEVFFGKLKSKQPFFGSDEEYMKEAHVHICVCMSVWDEVKREKHGCSNPYCRLKHNFTAVAL